jgi:hypothetical protein
VPKPYESYFLSDSGSFFTTRIFGQSAYMQLSANAPTALRTGGEDGGEIGAWAGMNTPAKISGLRAKAEEYMSFGLIPVVVFET